MRLSALVLAVSLIACGGSEMLTSPLEEFDPAGAMLVQEGTFVGTPGHAVSGTAQLYDDGDRVVLLIDEFSTTAGPDLKVYLSAAASNVDFVRLGDLRSTTGRQAYLVPESTDLNAYPFVLIWCERFSVLFGSAKTQ